MHNDRNLLHSSAQPRKQSSRNRKKTASDCFSWMLLSQAAHKRQGFVVSAARQVNVLTHLSLRQSFAAWRPRTRSERLAASAKAAKGEGLTWAGRPIKGHSWAVLYSALRTSPRSLTLRWSRPSRPSAPAPCKAAGFCNGRALSQNLEAPASSGAPDGLLTPLDSLLDDRLRTSHRLAKGGKCRFDDLRGSSGLIQGAVCSSRGLLGKPAKSRTAQQRFL